MNINKWVYFKDEKKLYKKEIDYVFEDGYYTSLYEDIYEDDINKCYLVEDDCLVVDTFEENEEIVKGWMKEFLKNKVKEFEEWVKEL